MKDSGIEWIGEIPKDWRFEKGKFHFLCRKTIPGIQSYKYQRLALTLNGVIKRSKNDSDGLQPKDFNTYQLLRKNELVFKLIDLQNVSTSRVGLAHYTGLVSPAYVVLHPNDDIYPEYIEKFYLSMWHREIFNALGDDGVRSNLNSSQLLNVRIPIPSYSEQQKIADFLDKKCSQIDALRANIEKQIEILEEYRKSVITEAVTKGLDPNVEMKDSGIEWIGKIPKDWEIARLKYKLSENMKYGASESGIEFSEELPRYIRITDITSDNKLKNGGKLSITEKQAKNYLLTDETVLFARSGGTVGKTFLYYRNYGRAAFAGYLISAVANREEMLPKWLYYYTLSSCYQEWVNSIFTQATIQNIGADKYSNLHMVIPSISIQSQILKYLDQECSQIDSIISTKKDQIEILDSYKKSLIYEYVTGKKEVPNE